ncbi:WYL domain-containing protein [Marinobacterium zhoushanense]|uniref:WYL domain-containing protein n=1 Tax=Marinobacterium zhoushanense TaxID=1679163 RepID=A0ABQ1K2Q5_9GAMM|nr:WYL domain-containing protein [Marinobacterium zhoushanense]GGB82061.1 WYL domain-containing protein [Marinobacterium zhoushanense]
MIEETENLKWEVLLRYRYIEIIALWEGRLTTNHLCNTFGIRRQQASRDISHYKTLAEHNLDYDTSLKGYTPSPSFQPIFTKGYVDEYLNLLDSHSLLDGFVQRIDLPSANTFVIRAPQRRAEPEIVRKVVEACRTKQRLELNYASMTNPTGEERIIVPHALVSSGYRWHVRAYCEKNRDYRDFVLGRILECGDLMGEVEYELPDDSLWHEQIELRLIPNPHLTPEQRTLVRHERCFQGDVLILKTRKATAVYLLQLLQVPTSPPSNESTDHVNANPMVLEDYEVIENLQFKRRQR